MRLPITVLLTGLASSVATAQTGDTTRVDVGSALVDASFMKPHAARVKIYRGDSLVSQWVNELTIGDSAGRRIMRWVTTGEPARDNPNRPLTVLRQTYDARTLAPLGYHNAGNSGAFTRLRIDGTSVTGTRRTASDTTERPVQMTIDRPGFFGGASDLVPIGAGLKKGQLFISPVWSPGSEKTEDRVFKVIGDTTVNVEGTPVKSIKVEERRRANGTLFANWYLMLESPYMVYGEVPLPDGRVQRLTEVAIPVTGR
jgi:hypothetical protein